MQFEFNHWLERHKHLFLTLKDLKALKFNKEYHVALLNHRNYKEFQICKPEQMFHDNHCSIRLTDGY